MQAERRSDNGLLAWVRKDPVLPLVSAYTVVLTAAVGSGAYLLAALIVRKLSPLVCG